MAEVGSMENYRSLLMTLSVLFCIFPLEVLAGYGWNHDKIFSVIVGNVLWFTSACTFNVFPASLWLVFCVLGLAAVLVYKDFENAPKAGLQAVGATMVLTGVVLGISYTILLPRLDATYMEAMEQRANFYCMVNDKWIPGLQSIFSDIAGGFGPGVDVTGDFNRNHLFSYNSSDTYRVSVDRLPEGTLYLKGFVGGTYGKSTWEGMNDRHLERYYRENGLTLPENYAELVNISYEAVSRRLEMNSDVEHITIEELGGKGSYSIYPYGALLTEDFQVHSDGSVARKSKEYEFQYHFMRGNGSDFSLAGDWQRLEQQYRQYVYDSFLDYPEERLPVLTASLKQGNISTDSALACALDLMYFLENRAVYDLDAGRNPAGTDFVEYFLFESHRGYCVHFASAGVLAFRYFGIPARYATGYVVSPGDFSRDGDGYTAVLTGKQAHAWVEIYLDEIGWVPVEMTPGAVAFSGDNRIEVLGGLDSWQEDDLEIWEQNEQESITPTAKPVEEDEMISAMEPEDDLPVQEPVDMPEEEKNQMDSLEEPEEIGEGVEDDKGGGQASGGEGQDLRHWLVISAMILTVCGLAVLWMRLQSIGKRHWSDVMQRSGRNERSFLLYRNLRKALRIAGCSEKVTMRGEEFWLKVQENCPELSEGEYEVFCTIMEKSTFGKTELSIEELRQICGFHDKLVGGVYMRSPFYKRVLFQVWRCMYRVEDTHAHSV